MNPEPQTFAEYKAAYEKLAEEKGALKAELSDLEEQNEAAKRIISRYKRKFGSLDDEPRPGITRARF